MKFIAMLMVLVFASFVLFAPEAQAAPVTHTGPVQATRAEGTKFMFMVDGHWYETTSLWIEREIRDARNASPARPVTVTGSGSGTNTVGNPSTATTAQS